MILIFLNEVALRDAENALQAHAFFATIGRQEDAGQGGGSVDQASIVRRLNTQWAGREIIYLEEVDSTNRYARALAQQGAAHGTLVLANRQTAGRGRRGRSWISPADEGVFMSLLLRPELPPAQVARLSLRTALATAHAIRQVTGLDARIKWPNDIVAAGRKVCGMLLEMDATPERVNSVVAGVGINVHQTHFDEEIAHSASSLDLLSGRRIDRNALVCAFLEAFECAYALDDAHMMRDYRACSATIGQRVQVIGLKGSYTGTAQGVTESGTLLVCADEDGTVREVLAADVSVRGLMGYA